jgi:hypothetical protein
VSRDGSSSVAPHGGWGESHPFPGWMRILTPVSKDKIKIKIKIKGYY